MWTALLVSGLHPVLLRVRTVLLVNTPVRVLLATAVLQESTPGRGGRIATTARLVDTPVVPEGPIRVPHVLRASTNPELAREVA